MVEESALLDAVSALDEKAGVSGLAGSLQRPHPLFRVRPSVSVSAVGSPLASSISGVIGFPRHLLFPLLVYCTDPSPRPLAVAQWPRIVLSASTLCLPCFSGLIRVVLWARAVFWQKAIYAWAFRPGSELPWGACGSLPPMVSACAVHCKACSFAR